MKDASYDILGVNVEKIRNPNELQVAKLMPEVLAEFSDYKPEALDIEDIYALTLNNLPPRYKQPGTIVLTGKLTDEEVREEIRRSVEKVELYPTAPRKY